MVGTIILAVQQEIVFGVMTQYQFATLFLIVLVLFALERVAGKYGWF